MIILLWRTRFGQMLTLVSLAHVDSQKLTFAYSTTNLSQLLTAGELPLVVCPPSKLRLF